VEEGAGEFGEAEGEGLAVAGAAVVLEAAAGGAADELGVAGGLGEGEVGGVAAGELGPQGEGAAQLGDRVAGSWRKRPVR
jgi:hypothetical protein